MDAAQDRSSAQLDPEELEGKGITSPVTAHAQDDTAQQPAQEVARLLQWHLPAILTHEVPLQETASPVSQPGPSLTAVLRMSGWKGALDVLLQFLLGEKGKLRHREGKRPAQDHTV